MCQNLGPTRQRVGTTALRCSATAVGLQRFVSTAVSFVILLLSTPDVSRSRPIGCPAPPDAGAPLTWAQRIVWANRIVWGDLAALPSPATIVLTN